jgi:APA family basic amino acid/polyamine antiporter
LVAVLAASILLTATNAGLMGISRLAFSMSSYRQLPVTLSRIHHRFRTPYIAIILFCLVAFLLLIPGFFTTGFFADLGALYVFGSLLTFALANAAVLALRVKKPDLPRPFKLGWNIKVKGRELPLTTILGLISTAAVWLVVVISQPYSRWVGIIWMVVGLIIYYLYRRKRRVSLTYQENEPAKSD